jgi:hypothetical protein
LTKTWLLGPWTDGFVLSTFFSWFSSLIELIFQTHHRFHKSTRSRRVINWKTNW